MRFLAVILLGLLGLLSPAGAAQTSTLKLERIAVAGREYVSLRDWAAAGRWQARWLVRDKTLALTNATQRLVFTASSAEAEINGVRVWLASTVLAHPHGLFISRLDLERTLQPLAFPPRNAAAQKIKTICLDPGHGGKDTGNCVGSLAEKKFTLLLAQEIRDQLKKSGLKVVLTRNYDSFVELPERPDKARRAGADLFVSLHFNAIATARTEVRGAEVYCLTPAGAFSTNARGEGNTAWVTGNRCNDKNLLLAWQIQKSLLRSLGAADRGVRRARFAVLRDAVMPAVLVEGGFMSHPDEGRKIFTAEYRRAMARAIVNGILAYKRDVER